MAGLAHDLGMAVRPTIGLTQADGLETMVRFDRLGIAEQRADAPADPVQAPFVIRDQGGRKAIVDQQLDWLPFHAAGRSSLPEEPPPRSSPPRVVGEAPSRPDNLQAVSRADQGCLQR